MIPKNIQELVADKVIEYVYKRNREDESQKYQMQKLQHQIDFLAKNIKEKTTLNIIQCTFCKAYLYDSDEFLAETKSYIYYLRCNGCESAICDDCLDEKGYDNVYHDVCVEDDCNFTITCRDPNHDFDSYCTICFEMVNAF